MDVEKARLKALDAAMADVIGKPHTLDEVMRDADRIYNWLIGGGWESPSKIAAAE